MKILHKTAVLLGLLSTAAILASCNVVSYEQRVAYLNEIKDITTRTHTLHVHFADSLDDGDNAWRQRAVNTMLDSLPVFEQRLQSMSLEVPAADTLRDAALMYLHSYKVGWVQEFEQVVKLYKEETYNPVRLAEINKTIEKLYNDFELRRMSAKEVLNGATLAFSIANRIDQPGQRTE